MPVIQRVIVVSLAALPFLALNPVVGAAPGMVGAQVTAVAPDGPAHQAGLEIDDVIVAVDTEPVRSADDYDKLLGGKRRVQLLVKRGREFHLVRCGVIHGRIGIGFAMTRP